MRELIVKTTNGEFQVFLGEEELGLVWPGASLIDEISIFHPADSNDLRVKIVFKNWLGGLHEAYHDKVHQTMNDVIEVFKDTEMSVSFWLRPQLAHLDEGDKFWVRSEKRNNGTDNNHV
jgi:hypothetical protein